jgi:putative oxygen-independent coproporphyrinogen III oxidase
MTSGAAEPLGVYVHWPFCLSKCPYCDFNSHVRAAIDEAGWRAALLAELDGQAARLRGRVVGSVFFGGGTPSLMAPDTVAAILDRIAARFMLADDVEITLEANPNSAEAARFRDLALAGIGRVSIGVQALDDGALRLLGRAHDTAEARRAIAAAASRFARFSFDLIYARPGQTRAAWRAELDAALALAGGHLSLYQLTFEPETRFAQLRARGDIVPLDDDTAAALFEDTQARLAAQGLPAYEISNHARPGEESRHNLGYWRYADYLGLGPGAHGRLTFADGKRALRNARAPETWIARVRATGDGLVEETAIAPTDAAREALVMGLRLAEGIDPARFARATGMALDAALDPHGLVRTEAGGFLRRAADGGIAATPAGLRVLDAVLAEIAR